MFHLKTENIPQVYIILYTKRDYIQIEINQIILSYWEISMTEQVV